MKNLFSITYSAVFKTLLKVPLEDAEEISGHLTANFKCAYCEALAEWVMRNILKEFRNIPASGVGDVIADEEYIVIERILQEFHLDFLVEFHLENFRENLEKPACL